MVTQYRIFTIRYPFQVGPKGRAAHAGLQAGDVIVEICKTPMTGKSHDDAKREMLRAGNDLDLLVER